MSIKRENLIKVGTIEVLVWRKQVKNLHLNVLPPDGKVRVTAPLNFSEDAIRTFVATKLSWIKKHQKTFQNQPRQTPREYVSGESHYFLGRRYILEVLEQDEKPRVYIKGKQRIILVCRPGSDREKRKDILLRWYRKHLSFILEKLVSKWEKELGVQARSWRVQRMKTKWGSCNPIKRTMTFNLELAKWSENCIEYVVLHELLHLIERKHNERFRQLLDKNMPLWRRYKDQLNQEVVLADFFDR